MDLKRIYLALAVVGAIVPYLFFAEHFASAGFSLPRFLGALYANPAAGGFTSDLLLSSFVFWIAMFQQHKAEGAPKPAPYILLNLLIGLSCALPAYLYVRLKNSELQSG